MKYNLKKTNLISVKQGLKENILLDKKFYFVLTSSFFVLWMTIACLTPGLQGKKKSPDKGFITADTAPPARENPEELSSGSVSEPEKICVGEGKVAKGDTPSTILEGHIPLKIIYDITRRSRGTFPLTKIRRGQRYRIFNRENAFSSFEYEINSDEKLVIAKTGNDYTINRDPIPYTTKTTRVAGEIETSLFAAVEKAGENNRLAMKLVEIFAWDIDFTRDIRPGDSFIVIVEKRFRDKKETGYGKILAASFTNQGVTNKAFLFKDSSEKNAYYNEKGVSLRKSFLKAPLTFSRISSGYSNNRLHPILKKWRPHKAIDYAAPKGTPIKTVGDGVVTVRKKTRAAGNYVKIRHNNGYETVYNHMSRFARGIKPGKRVAQGEVIGYVGSTGYATGPHLDFRMKKDGKYINPMKVKTTPANPVSPSDMPAFIGIISPLTARLNIKTELPRSENLRTGV